MSGSVLSHRCDGPRARRLRISPRGRRNAGPESSDAISTSASDRSPNCPTRFVYRRTSSISPQLNSTNLTSAGAFQENSPGGYTKRSSAEILHRTDAPSFHHSIIPPFHHSIIPPSLVLHLHHPLLEPCVLTPEDFLSDGVRRYVFVAPEPMELDLDALAGLAAEEVSDSDGVRSGRGIIPQQALRPRAGRGHREELRSDVHQAEQHPLPQLELRTEPHHRVEHVAGEATRAALHEAHVAGEGAELAVLRPEPPADPARRIPPAIEQRRADEPGEALARGLPRHDDVPRHLQVLVHRLARDEEVHDLGAALEDQIDAEIAQHALDGDGPLTARA